MATAIGLAALESLLAAGATRAIVADVDWPILRAVYETRRAQPLLTRMVTTPLVLDRASSNGEGAAVKRRQTDFASLTPVDRRNAIEEAVRREVAQVVGLRTADLVDPALNLFKMGLDSLMAIELKGRLERTIAVILPSALAFNYPSVDALVGFLDTKIAERVRTPDHSEDLTELLSRVPEMSVTEVDLLLTKMLAEEAKT
jgi:acyl carrier protein